MNIFYRGDSFLLIIIVAFSDCNTNFILPKSKTITMNDMLASALCVMFSVILSLVESQNLFHPLVFLTPSIHLFSLR